MPPWVDYSALMAYILVSLDKFPGVRPIGIGYTLRQSITTLVMRVEGYHAKIGCGSLQLWSGLDTSIEGAAHAVA